jgi:hypothetical protein
MSSDDEDIFIAVKDGGFIVLHQTIGVPKRDWFNPRRNVIRYSKDNKNIWTISSPEHIEGGDRFATYVGFEPMPNGDLHVHASDGCVYRLNVDTGEATFLEWEK